MNNRPVTTVEDSPAPEALIIGSGLVPGYLLRALEDAGCRTDLASGFGSPPDRSKKYDYIFQFDADEMLLTTAGMLRQPAGRMLFISTSQDATLPRQSPATMRVLNTGPLERCNPHDITDRILSTLFATEAAPTITLHAETPAAPTDEPAAARRTSIPTPLPPAYSPPITTAQTVRSEQGRTAPYLPFRSPPLTVHVTTSRAGIRQQLKSSSKPHPPAVPRVEVRRHSLLPIALTGLTVLLVATIATIAGLTWWHARGLQDMFTQMQRHAQSSDWNGVQQDLTAIQERLGSLDRIHTVISAAVPPLGKIRLMEDAGAAVESAATLADAAADAAAFFRDFRLFDTPSFDGARITEQDIARAAEKIDQVRHSLEETSRHLESELLPQEAKTQLRSYLTTGIGQLTAAQQLLPIAQHLLAKEGRRTYLVLLQNPMELRPTGGFIGSFALMTVEGGTIREWRIMDVYDADGQLTGHVDPPLPIRTHLSQPNWFLRDSNFDPDFAVSATWAAWFLEKELGQKVDGVLGVNVFFAQQLLRVTGPMQLPDFNDESVYAQTLFSKAHSYAHSGFFPGSSQKKDFLTAVTNGLLGRFSTAKSLPWLDLLSVMKTSLEEKHVMIFSTDRSLQALVEERGWAGRLARVRCTEQSGGAPACQADYLAVIESNLGANKANYVVTKSVQMQKSVNARGAIATILTISYDNTNTQNNQYQEPYVNYLRVLVPRGSTLTGLTVNDAPLAVSGVDNAAYGSDKQVFGFPVRIPPQQTGEVKIAYTLPGTLQPATTRYQLIYQKQSGDKTSPLLLSVAGQAPFILTPANFRASAKSDLASATHDQSFTFSSDTAVDRVFVFSVGSAGT